MTYYILAMQIFSEIQGPNAVIALIAFSEFYTFRLRWLYNTCDESFRKEQSLTLWILMF